MSANSADEITLTRNVMAVAVPRGDEVILREGWPVRVTQALGGSFTVYVRGNLYRIAGQNADALGLDPLPEPSLSPDASDEDVEAMVWEQLRTCFDPEIPINIVDLGLVYKCEVHKRADDTRAVDIEMTLTAPGCGMGDILVDDVRTKVALVPSVEQVQVDLVFDPPWGKEMMSEAARLEAGLF